MTKIILNCHPAERAGAFTQVAIMSDGPVPGRIVDIADAADAARALAAYAAEVKATGAGARVFMTLARGERAPRGFRGQRAWLDVNLDAEPAATAPAPAPKIELTEIGEQYVVPGCERVITARGSQLGLWE